MARKKSRRRVKAKPMCAPPSAAIISPPKPEPKPKPIVLVLVTVSVKSRLPMIVDAVRHRIERMGWRLISVQRQAKSVTFEFAVEIKGGTIP